MAPLLALERQRVWASYPTLSLMLPPGDNNPKIPIYHQILSRSLTLPLSCVSSFQGSRTTSSDRIEEIHYLKADIQFALFFQTRRYTVLVFYITLSGKLIFQWTHLFPSSWCSLELRLLLSQAFSLCSCVLCLISSGFLKVHRGHPQCSPAWPVTPFSMTTFRIFSQNEGFHCTSLEQFFNFVTIDIWGQIMLCCGGLWWVIFCQLPWAPGLQDIWSNIILSLSVRVFWMRLTFELQDWVKQIALPKVSGPYPINWRSEWNKKAEWEGILRQELIPLALLSFQLAYRRFWDFSASMITSAISL